MTANNQPGLTFLKTPRPKGDVGQILSPTTYLGHQF